MRLKEEKTLMLIALIGVIFIVFSTIMIEISNKKLEEWRDVLFYHQNISNNLMLNLIDANSSYQYYRLVKILQPNISIVVNDFEYLDNKWVSKEILKTYEKFKTKEISDIEFLNGLIKSSYNIYLKLYNQYNIKIDELNQFSTNKPKLRIFKSMFEWSLVKKVFNIIRSIAIVLSAFLYLQIYIQIKNRSSLQKSK